MSEFAALQGERKQYKITRYCSTPGPGSVTAHLNLIKHMSLLISSILLLHVFTALPYSPVAESVTEGYLD